MTPAMAQPAPSLRTQTLDAEPRAQERSGASGAPERRAESAASRQHSAAGNSRPVGSMGPAAEATESAAPTHAAAAERLARDLGYAFNDPGLLTLALTHKSFANEHPAEAPAHNERLEFLGDAVLDLVVSDLLCAHFPDLAEGELSKLRASLVTEASLAELARELDLGAALRVGRGESATGGRAKASLLADSLEAVMAAIYLDAAPRVEAATIGGTHGGGTGAGGTTASATIAGGGLAAVHDVLARLIGGRIEQALDLAAVFDFKTELQEWAQKRYKEPVRYRIVSQGGPEHEKTFEAAVMLRDQELGRGRGRSKKQAEQAAARLALDAIKSQTPTTSGARP
jgi:ribonuclease III